MQHMERGKHARAAYHAYLQSDHDFRVWADVLTLEEKEVESDIAILDGQVNLTKPDGPDAGPARTASLILSDPRGALNFGTTFAEDSTGTLWVNRLVRIHHEVVVPNSGIFAPGAGRWTTTCMIGVPMAVSRSGGEVGLELSDKSVLADHGVRPRTYRKGTNVRAALVSILHDLTGEHHHRIPTTKRTLSQPYTVGMGEDSLTPWQAFKQIARREMGWRAFYSADGYATCEGPRAHKQPLKVTNLLALPDSSTSFGDFVNYVKVTSKRQMQNRGHNNKPKGKPYTVIFQGVTVLPKQHRLSEVSLARHGVPRTLPLVIDNDNLKTAKAVNEAAIEELRKGSGVDYDQTYETMPFFHLDSGDRLDMGHGIGIVPFEEGSIPLGTTGNMTIGRVRWVSRPVTVKHVRSKRTVVKKKKKGGRANG